MEFQEFVEKLEEFIDGFQLYTEGDEYRDGYRNGYYDALVYMLDWAQEEIDE